MSAITLAAHAKVNLFLRVLAREEDGYHGIETLCSLLDLHDVLTVERRDAPGVTCAVHGADVGPADQNLAVRAADKVLQAIGRPFGVHLDLQKRIPVQAGLGGGSSDGAAALLAVNQIAGHAVPGHELLQFAAQLGSDVPFLLLRTPLALAWGHGERLLRLPPLPAAPALLLAPPVAVSTADAYRWVSDARRQAGRRGAVALDLDAVSSWGSVGRLAGNDFEAVVFGKHPAVRSAFEALCNTHPLLCRMSGSGSSLIAVYRSEREREDAAVMLGPKHGTLHRVTTLAQGPA
jgi:4-diphosphocytidyl-2-C-methyl-D-erythritol kinase